MFNHIMTLVAIMCLATFSGIYIQSYICGFVAVSFFMAVSTIVLAQCIQAIIYSKGKKQDPLIILSQSHFFGLMMNSVKPAI